MDIKIIILKALTYFRNFIYFLFFLRAILSWVSSGISDNKLYRALLELTEPILVPIRKLLYKTPLGGPGMMIDFSLLIASMVIELVYKALVSIILYI